MTRWLAALLLAAGLASAPAVHAQFATVRLYGSINMDVEVVDGVKIDGHDPAVVRVSSNSSRFGLRGIEYLGYGQVAIVQLESSIQADSGGLTLASRETFVGLQGDWGTFKMGSYLTPYDDIHPIFGNAPTFVTSILSTAALWSQGSLTKDQGGFDARVGNSLRYETPLMGGFSAEAQFATRDTSNDPNGDGNGDSLSEKRRANVTSIGVFYSDGPIELGVAYEHNYRVRPTGRNDGAFSITGAYDFGHVIGGVGLRIGAVYEHLRYDTPSGDLTRDFYGASATMSVGEGSFYAFYGYAGDGKGSAIDGTAIGALTKGPDTASAQWEVSYTYNLSLRTALYAGWVRIANRPNAAYTFNINDYTTAPGSKPSGFVMGIAHFF